MLPCAAKWYTPPPKESPKKLCYFLVVVYMCCVPNMHAQRMIRTAPFPMTNHEPRWTPRRCTTSCWWDVESGSRQPPRAGTRFRWALRNPADHNSTRPPTIYRWQPSNDRTRFSPVCDLLGIAAPSRQSATRHGTLRSACVQPALIMLFVCAVVFLFGLLCCFPCVVFFVVLFVCVCCIFCVFFPLLGVFGRSGVGVVG